MMDVRQVAAAGTGMMGQGIAASYALGGRHLTIVSRTAEGAAGAVVTAKSLIRQLAVNDLAESSQAKEAEGGLTPSADLEAAVRGAQLVLETIPENLILKQEFFARLDKVSPDAILCSNTSGISITARASRPEPILTTH